MAGGWFGGHTGQFDTEGPMTDETIRAAPPPPAPAPGQGFPLATRDASFSNAAGLLIQSMPYALARFGVLLGASVVALLGLVITLGGTALLADRVAGAFGVIWLVGCLAAAGFVWGTLLRYVLHLIECGHVAVLTELITKGSLPAGGESMFAHGKRVVTERFGQANVLFGLNMLVRGIVQAFHRTLDWIADILPLPGLDSLSRLINIVLRAATRYLDKVIFSYSLTRPGIDAWQASREGLVYYCQNAKPVLKTAMWSVVLEYVTSAVLWLLLLVPAGLITYALPAASREWGGIVTIVVAVLLLGPLRSAFIKPVFLIMMMVRFHTAIEGQAVNPEWDARLAGISDKFRNFGNKAALA
jgi:hypothetical protein